MVDRLSQAEMQVISVDLETDTFGQSNQIDQHTLKVSYFQAV